MYTNQLPNELAQELADARRLGVEPMRVDNPRFSDIANQGTLKWAVDVSSELWVMPKFVDQVELKHPVLVSGEPVLAAGEAEVAISDGVIFGIFIDNSSGHYRPNFESITIGRQTFAQYGVTFP